VGDASPRGQGADHGLQVQVLPRGLLRGLDAVHPGPLPGLSIWRPRNFLKEVTGYWLLVTGFILFEGLLENRLFCVHLSLVISNMRVFCSSPRPTIITTEHHSWE
jgi:hypothetical protein